VRDAGARIVPVSRKNLSRAVESISASRCAFHRRLKR
jgi:hypothetical protein